MAVYGNGDMLTEESPIDTLSHYAVSKLCGELYLKQYKQYGIDYTIYRLFNVYGYGQDMKNPNQGMASIYLAQAIKNGHVDVKGSFERYRDFVYIDDVVSALELGLDDKTNSEIYNVCTQKKTTVQNLLDVISDTITHGREPITYTNIGGYDGDQHGTTVDNSKLKSLGWDVTVDLNTGINNFYVDLCKEKELD